MNARGTARHSRCEQAAESGHCGAKRERRGRATPLLLHPSIRKARVLLVANLLPLAGVALWG
ncbi:MAG: hypothetical protein J0H25_10430 [Rhizobiales bacterium]|nr:hypothetical protein [Hyphomicrobiales bacterium]